MTLRHELPPLPHRMRDLPIQDGWPVPFFVAKPDGERYDLRMSDPRQFWLCVNHKLCWVCGKKLLRTGTFVTGAMCVISRTHAEPPSHSECAEYSALTCPYLTEREHRRRRAQLPDNVDTPGIMVDRHARSTSVVVLWRTHSYGLLRDFGDGTLIRVGDPERVLWYREGRSATYAEARAALDVAYETLLAIAKEDAEPVDAVRELEQRAAESYTYLPQEGT